MLFFFFICQPVHELSGCQILNKQHVYCFVFFPHNFFPGQSKTAKVLTAISDITHSAEAVARTVNENVASHPLSQAAETVLHSVNTAYPVVARVSEFNAKIHF